LLRLACLRIAELRPNARAHRVRGSFTEGIRYVWQRPDLMAMLVMLFLVGTFASISRSSSRPWRSAFFMSMRAVRPAVVLHGDRHRRGRTVERRPRPAAVLLVAERAVVFGIGCTLAAIAPGYWFFAAALVVIGVAALTLTNTSNSLMQLSTERAMRGRVMALRSPSRSEERRSARRSSDGWRTVFGPRWALAVGRLRLCCRRLCCVRLDASSRASSR